MDSEANAADDDVNSELDFVDVTRWLLLFIVDNRCLRCRSSAMRSICSLLSASATCALSASMFIWEWGLSICAVVVTESDAS